MPDPKKLGTTAAMLAIALSAGVAGGRISKSAPYTVSAKPASVRWLAVRNAAHPFRYGVLVAVKVGAGTLMREIICETDGTPPKLDGKPYPDAATMCAGIVVAAGNVETSIAGFADALATPVAAQ